nr:hypothetical protein [Gracilibacillus thailandensis]
MIKLCNKYNREMPTEIKLIYDVQGNKLIANYQYDLVHTNNPNQTANSIARSWFEEIKNNN